MKKVLSLILSVCLLLLAGCTQTPNDNSSDNLNNDIAKMVKVSEEIIEYDGNDKYYYYENKIYKNDTVVFEDEKDNEIYQLALSGDYIYYLCGNDSTYNALSRVLKNGTNKQEVLVSSQQFNGLNDMKIYNNNIFVCDGIKLYLINTNDLKPQLIHKDVNQYDVYGENVYYIEHAERTFTIYKKNINTQKIEKVLGDGVYSEDKNPTVPLYSKFVLTENGNFVFTQRLPYKLCEYTNGNIKVIENSVVNPLKTGHIYEESVIYKDEMIYYVRKENEEQILYTCVSSPEETITIYIGNLKDFSSGITVKNNYYYYKDKNNKTQKIKIN